MAQLERLVYASTATGGTRSLLNIATILGESHRNNARDGLTGALAAHNDRYVQVIEGASDVLDGLLRRLAKDARHRDIVVLGRGPARERLFGEWTMAHAAISPHLAPVLDALMADAMPSPARVTEVLLEAAVPG